MQSKEKFRGLPNRTVFAWDDLPTNLNLRDYDAVLIDVTAIDTEMVNWFEFEDIINPAICIDVLKPMGSYIIVLGDPDFFYKKNGATKAFMKWSPFNFTWIKGKGTSINVQDRKSSFGSYLPKVKEYPVSYSFITASSYVLQTYENQRFDIEVFHDPFLTTRAGYTVASSIWVKRKQAAYPYTSNPLFDGDFLLLAPTSRDSAEDIIEILNLMEEAEPILAPEWAESITVVGQEVVDDKIRKNHATIKRLKDEKQKLLENRDVIRQPVLMLYASGKPLELATKNVLEDMGAQVKVPKDTSKVEYTVAYNKEFFATEVKSTEKEHIDMKGLRQALDWSTDAYEETELIHKSLLVISTLYSLESSKRIESVPLPDNLQKYATDKQIAVLTVAVLFDAHQRIKKGTLTADAFFNLLSATNGLITLPSQDPEEPDKTE